MKKLKWIVAAVLLVSVMGLAFTAHAAESNSEQETTIQRDELNVRRGTVVSNVFVFGTSLSGRTEHEAMRDISLASYRALKTSLHATSADGDKVWTATLAELGVTLEDIDYTDIIKENTLTGSLLTRYKKAKAFEEKPLNIVAGMVIDEDSILEQIQEDLQEWNQEVEEASATVVDGEIEVIEGQNGHEYSFEPGVKAFLKALKAGTVTDGFELEFEYTTVEPKLSTEKVQGFSVIGSCTTGYDKPTDQSLINREINLVRGLGNMNGRVFAPGEVISMLEMYGEVSVRNGYAEAGTYNESGHIESVGGGLCQVASTTYNAALMAELKIVHREHHRFMVAYLDPSLDAMIYAPTKNDFKFENDSSDYIILDTHVDKENQKITVNIIGHEDHPDTHSVRYESEILSMQVPPYWENMVVKDPDLQCGVYVQTPKFKAGEDLFIVPAITSRSWKITTDNGVETKTILNSSDSYRGCAQGKVYCSPDCTIILELTEDRASSYISLQTYFEDSNKTSVLITSPQGWAQFPGKAQFNEDMKAYLESNGLYGWTATGDEPQVFFIPSTEAPEQPTEPEGEEPPVTE